MAAALGLAAAASDLRAVNARTLAPSVEAERDHISALDLATLIMDGNPSLRVFDLRAPSEFANTHVPGATHATIETLRRAALPHDATVVLYAEGETDAAQAWTLLRMRGYRHAFVLRNGMIEWQARVMEPRLPVDATERERADFARAVDISKFFGGRPREGVPRAEAPPTSAGTRRRGC